MTDKRRPHLRDELSASLAGLDDLAAELGAPPPPPPPPVAEPDTPSLEDLDPGIGESFDEVRELADAIAAPEPPAEVPPPPPPPPPASPPALQTRHMSLAAETTVYEVQAEPAEAFELEPVDPEVDGGNIWYEEVAPPADEPAATAPDAEMELSLEEMPHHEAEASAKGPDGMTFEQVELDPAARYSGTNSAMEATAAAATGRDLGAGGGDTTGEIEVAVAPAAVATIARPWTPAAAMEPLPPLAPPPTRPQTPGEAAASSLPADGGRKMNILPALVIGIFLAVIIAAIVIVVLFHN